MNKLQLILLMIAVIVIIMGAVVLNTEVVWARPAGCDCVCDCANWTVWQLQNAHCQAGLIYAYPCGREDPTISCYDWCIRRNPTLTVEN